MIFHLGINTGDNCRNAIAIPAVLKRGCLKSRVNSSSREGTTWQYAGYQNEEITFLPPHIEQ
ncbi:MAG: hypothetical protein PF489_07845 [Salinivirgaceae bacterium]|jgi:hypothetical protein|nr:hypothetical protein [Salinivirgaceae bacterium]